MFAKLASDALGLSDIGSIIKPEDYDKVASDDYIFNEEGEKIYFLIKSQTDEYCFTNYALIHLDGSSATSKKRLLKRLSYKNNSISDVKLETAGTVDLDVEIKFNMGNTSYSIDVRKSDLTPLKDLYKTLIKIGAIQLENTHFFRYVENSLHIAENAVKYSSGASNLEEQFKAINQYTFNCLKQAHENYMRKDFGDVFEKFIRN